MSQISMVSITSTTLPKRNKVYITYRSRLVKTDFQPYRQHRQTPVIWPTNLRVQFQYCPLSGNGQAAYALSRLRTLNEDTTPLKDELPFLAIDAQDKNNSHECVTTTDSDKIILLKAQPITSLSKPPKEDELVVQQELEA